jgi:hypothetical protein
MQIARLVARYNDLGHPQDVLTASLEAGLSTLLFNSTNAGLLEEWMQIGRFTALTVSDSGDIFEASTKVYFSSPCRKSSHVIVYHQKTFLMCGGMSQCMH